MHAKFFSLKKYDFAVFTSSTDLKTKKKHITKYNFWKFFVFVHQRGGFIWEGMAYWQSFFALYALRNSFNDSLILWDSLYLIENIIKHIFLRKRCPTPSSVFRSVSGPFPGAFPGSFSGWFSGSFSTCRKVLFYVLTFVVFSYQKKTLYCCYHKKLLS